MATRDELDNSCGLAWTAVANVRSCASRLLIHQLPADSIAAIASSGCALPSKHTHGLSTSPNMQATNRDSCVVHASVTRSQAALCAVKSTSSATAHARTRTARALHFACRPSSLLQHLIAALRLQVQIKHNDGVCVGCQLHLRCQLHLLARRCATGLIDLHHRNASPPIFLPDQ